MPCTCLSGHLFMLFFVLVVMMWSGWAVVLDRSRINSVSNYLVDLLILDLYVCAIHIHSYELKMMDGNIDLG
jgi:hypothetical protein